MRLPALSTDPRTRREVDEYLACFGGVEKTQGPSGTQSLLAFGVDGFCTFQADGSVATAQTVGDLPAGVWLGRIINHTALEAASTIVIALPAYGGEDAVTLVNAQAADAVGEFTIANGVYTPLPISRPVQITVTGGASDDVALISIEVHPIVRGWR